MADQPSDVPQAPEAAPPAPPPRFDGAIDQLANGRLTGWAVDGSGAPCIVLIRIDGIDTATAESNAPRPDLQAKQISQGLGGWYADLGPLMAPGEHEIAVLLPDGTPLRGSPVRGSATARLLAAEVPEGAPLSYVGAIDSPNADVISGWSIGSDFKAASVVVQVDDGAPVTVNADHDRPDLIAQLLTKSGGGWSIDIRPHLKPGRNSVRITFPDGTDLPGSPIERVVAGAEPAPQPAPAPVTTQVPPPAPQAAPVAPPAPKPEPVQVAPTAPAPPAPEPVQAAPAPVPAPVEKPTPVRASEGAFSRGDKRAADSNVTPFPAKPAGKPAMPSLNELDELSLDDISLAIAAGMINVAPPEAPEPVPEPEPLVEARRQAAARRPGFFARLLGRG